MPINTKRVTGRRTLHFDTLDEVLRDAEAMAARPHRSLGNLTLGQVTAHLAQWIEFTLDGYPPMRVPLPMKLVGRLIRGRMTRQTHPPGIAGGAKLGEAFRSPDATTDEGLARLRRAVERMKTEPLSGGRHASPLFGRMSHEQWDRFHCRHAELHLSFIVPA